MDSEDVLKKISSTKSMDITTPKAKDLTKQAKPDNKIVLNNQKPIVDINQDPDIQEVPGSQKLTISDNISKNLKSPSSAKKTLQPLDETNSSNNKQTDSITEDDDRDTSFIDKIIPKDKNEDEKTINQLGSSKDSGQEMISSDLSTEKTEINKKSDENTNNSEVTDNNEKAPNEDSPPESDGIVNELAEQAAENKKAKLEEKALDERSQQIEGLVEAKTYYVPIGQITHKRHTRLVAFLLIFILLGSLFALDLAMDAGKIDLGVQPLTDFIAD